MFEKLQELTGSLFTSELNLSKYAQVKEARKKLQLIKVEAQSLRAKITEEFKKIKAS